MGSGCIDSHFLDLGTSWRWVVSFTPLLLYPQGKSPRYPLDRSLGWPQSQSGRRGEEKILDPTWTRTLTSRSSSVFIVVSGVESTAFCVEWIVLGQHRGLPVVYIGIRRLDLDADSMPSPSEMRETLLLGPLCQWPADVRPKGSKTARGNSVLALFCNCIVHSVALKSLQMQFSEKPGAHCLRYVVASTPARWMWPSLASFALPFSTYTVVIMCTTYLDV
jgi:hypothetical protein